MQFTIVTAVFNSKSSIGACIESIQGQTYPDIEHIVIDGGSTDGTLEVISSLTHSRRTRELRVISEPDNGIYDAMNKGIRMATGDVIGFLNADDLYATDAVLKTVAGCFERQNADSCYGDLLYVDKNNTDKTIRYWKSSPFDSALLKKGWMPPHPTFFVRKEIYERYGTFNTDFKIASDYELMLRFLEKKKISTCYIPEVLIRMRVGGVSNRISNIIRKSFEDYRVMKMHHIGGLPVLLHKNLSKIPQFFKNSKK